MGPNAFAATAAATASAATETTTGNKNKSFTIAYSISAFPYAFPSVFHVAFAVVRSFSKHFLTALFPPLLCFVFYFSLLLSVFDKVSPTTLLVYLLRSSLPCSLPLFMLISYSLCARFIACPCCVFSSPSSSFSPSHPCSFRRPLIMFTLRCENLHFIVCTHVALVSLLLLLLQWQLLLVVVVAAAVHA